MDQLEVNNSNADEAKGNEETEVLKSKFTILSGVPEDVEKLIKEFIAADSIRFETFSAIWRKHKFSLIFWGLFKFHERLEFTEEIFKLALSYTQPPNSFPTCAAGVYLLYSLYLKQPIVPKVRIRVTVQQWRGLQDVSCLAYQQSHHDLTYIFHYLQLNNALDYVATPALYCSPWPLYSVRNRPLDANEWNFLSKKSKLAEYCDEGHIDILSTIHEKYEEMKSQLSNSSGFDATTIKSLIENPSNIPEAINRQIRKFRVRKNCGRIAPFFEDAVEESQSEDEDSDEEMEASISTRARLKEEIYARPVGMAKSRISKLT